MELQSELSSDGGCTATQTASQEQCFSQAISHSNHRRSDSAIGFAQDEKANRFSLTPFTQYSTCFQEHKPEHLCRWKPATSTNQVKNNRSPTVNNPFNTLALIPINNRNHSTCQKLLPFTQAPPQKIWHQYNETINTETNNLLKMPEKSLGRVERFGQFSQAWAESNQGEESLNIGPGTFGLFAPESSSSAPKYDILQPMKIARVTRSLQGLETDFVANLMQIRKNVEQRLESGSQSDECIQTYSWVEQGKTRLVITFSAAEQSILPSVHQLQQVFRELELNLLECKYSLSDEHDCSEIWTRLEALKDNVICLEDALLDFGESLGRMHDWMIKFFASTCVYFASKSEKTASDPGGDSAMNMKIEVDLASASMLLKQLLSGSTTSRLSIFFYQECLSRIKAGVDGFLSDIPEGTLSMDDLVIWSRLCNSSLEDISRALKSFLKISGNIASEMP